MSRPPVLPPTATRGQRDLASGGSVGHARMSEFAHILPTLGEIPCVFGRSQTHSRTSKTRGIPRISQVFADFGNRSPTFPVPKVAGLTHVGQSRALGALPRARTLNCGNRSGPAAVTYQPPSHRLAISLSLDGPTPPVESSPSSQPATPPTASHHRRWPRTPPAARHQHPPR